MTTELALVTYAIWEGIPEDSWQGITCMEWPVCDWNHYLVDESRIVAMFQALNWREAMQKYNDHFGYGPYRE
jgi:hypothetical protein